MWHCRPHCSFDTQLEQEIKYLHLEIKIYKTSHKQLAVNEITVWPFISSCSGAVIGDDTPDTHDTLISEGTKKHWMTLTIITGPTLFKWPAQKAPFLISRGRFLLWELKHLDHWEADGGWIRQWYMCTASVGIRYRVLGLDSPVVWHTSYKYFYIFVLKCVDV